MKITRNIFALSAAGLLLGAAACSDLSEVNDRLDQLEGKVQVLESVIPTLNSNIEALQTLAGGGTINKVEEKDGVYTITLSNGQTLTINQGSVGVANAPVMSLDKDGYWMVDYGTGAEYLLVNGNKVNATGESGVTPVFGVDAEGNWTVSYDSGKTYENVLGADGKPVPAVPQEGSGEYFEDVVYDGKTFTVKLKDGPEISLPVVTTFYFAIEAEGVQVLQAGQTKTYPVKSAGVLSATIVAKPANVEVTLDENVLTVYALPETKAVSADSRKDIAVLAVSAEGFATIAKIQVTVGGEVVDPTPDPEPEDPMPSEPSNDYEKYMAGQDIAVGDITINKAAYGDAVLITNESENKNIASNGVYFVASDATDVTINGTASQLVVLSLDSAVATIKRTENKSFYVNASAENDYMIFSNIKYETVMTSGNVFGIGGDGEVETIIFNKCKIEVPADMNMLYGGKNILNINMTDCDVKLHNGTGTKNLFQTNTTSTYASVVFKNNVIYCTDGTISNFGLFSNNNATITSLEMRNNTLAQVYAKGTSGYVSAKDVKAADVVLNLFYVPDFSTIIPDKYVGIIWVPNTVDDSSFAETIKSNLAYYNADSVPTYKIKGTYYKGVGTVYSKAKADNPIPSPDYANGIFTVSETYKSYGAKR